MAAPGAYDAVLTFGTHVDTMQLTWSADPRTTFDWVAYASGKAHRKLVDDEVERLAGLMQELAVAEETMKAMTSVWSLLDNTEDVDSLQAHMSGGIKDIREMLWTPQDFVGYDHVTERVMDVLYAAQPDLSKAPGPNSQRKLALARAQVDDMVAQVDALKQGLWQALMAAADEVQAGMDEVWQGIAAPNE